MMAKQSGELPQAPGGAPPAAPPAAGPEAARKRSPSRWLRAPRGSRYSLPGAWLALAFAVLSFTPSLLPRDAAFQGAVTGLTAAIGYGVGVLGAWVWREYADRGPRVPRPRSWRVFLVTAAVALAVAFLLGQRWQGQIRELMGVEPEGPSLVFVPLVAGVVFLLVLALGRGLRAVYRRLAALLERGVGARAARATGLFLVAGGTWFVVSGVLLDGLVSVADQTFAVRNTITPKGVEQPTSTLRAGGPGSLVPWDSLGREGRVFTGRDPSVADISAFTGSPATEPIRIFAGTDSADDAEARADLAVRDLQRAGGFDRSYLLVAATTGSGWLEPSSVNTFEFMTGGDSAIVAMQYSHLPSWLSYLVDQDRAREAGRELFDAVYDRWSKLPPDDRPRLLVFGESLGSFGGETAFSGEYDMANRTGGVLFVGPPSFNPLYREFSDGRDKDSPEVEPLYRNGRTIRFTARAGERIGPASAPWEGTRVLYLMHPSDPIVWWSPNLLLKRPDWLKEPAGSDVLDEMVWIPFVTFWQVTADLPHGMDVPAGHGHVYTGEHVDGWAAVLQPPGWTKERSRALREIITATR
jgi:uncharacterized membrane protein